MLFADFLCLFSPSERSSHLNRVGVASFSLVSTHTYAVPNTQVAVLGAAGGIGQPLSLLMNQSPMVKELSLFDVSPITPGVACDLSHNNFNCKVISLRMHVP